MPSLLPRSGHAGHRKKGSNNSTNKKVPAVAKPYVRVYLDAHTYWTVSINTHSTAKEICASVAQKLERSEEVFELHVQEAKSGEDKMLRDDDLILVILNSWGGKENRFIVKELISSPLKAPREFMRKEKILDDMNSSKRLSLSIQQLQKLTGVPDEFTLDPVDLLITEKISAGASSRVFRGKFRNADVALKVMRVSDEVDYTETFQKELLICTSVRDPNVVQFYGACLLPPTKLCIVMEYCSRGNLYSAMKQRGVYLGWEMFFKIAIGAVKGINTLHSWNPVIVHRDIKSQNLLVCDNWEVKVCDFGLSRTTIMDNMASLAKLRGTYTYCPPEIYFGETYTAKSDIFSIGIVLWELVARCIYGVHRSPYYEYKDGIDFEFQIFIRTSKQGLRPTLPPNTPPGLSDLITWMWQSDPKKRPNSLQVLDKLSILHKEFLNNKHTWDQLIPSPG